MRDFKIFYDRTLSSTLDVLTGNKDLQLFRTKAEALCFCANYGYENKKKKKVENGVEVASSAVEKYKEYIFAIALIEKEDPHILKDTSECCKIFQQYANGGLNAISKILQKKKAKDPHGVETLLDIIISARNSLKDVHDEEEEITLPEKS